MSEQTSIGTERYGLKLLLDKPFGEHKVRSLSWEPDGTQLAVGCWDGTVALFNLSTGEFFRPKSAHTDIVHSVAWAPDGNWLISCSKDQRIILWRAASLEKVRTFRGHGSSVLSLAWSQDNDMFASGSCDKTVRIWSKEKTKPLNTIASHEHYVQQVCWSPDNRLIASASTDSAIQIYDIEKQQPYWRREAHTGGVRALAWHPGGSHLASGGDDAFIRIWSLRDRDLKHSEVAHQNRISSLCYSPDGSLLASKSKDGTISLWLVDPWTRVAKIEEKAETDFGRIEFDPSGTRLATLGCNERGIRIWEVERNPSGLNCYSTVEGETSQTIIQSTPHKVSVFISYSSQDEDFAKRLHADLQNKGVRCWFAPHNIQGGQKIHEQIDQAIRVYDKLLLVLSENSMRSEWVKTEIANARQREIAENRQVLFPIRLVDFDKIKNWTCFDADTGKDSAREIREYFIPDFSTWKDLHAYQKAFDRLCYDLKAEAKEEQRKATKQG